MGQRAGGPLRLSLHPIGRCVTRLSLFCVQGSFQALLELQLEPLGVQPPRCQLLYQLCLQSCKTTNSSPTVLFHRLSHVQLLRSSDDNTGLSCNAKTMRTQLD